MLNTRRLSVCSVVRVGAATIGGSLTYGQISTFSVQVAICVLEVLASANNLCREAIFIHGGIPVLLQASMPPLRWLNAPCTRSYILVHSGHPYAR